MNNTSSPPLNDANDVKVKKVIPTKSDLKSCRVVLNEHVQKTIGQSPKWEVIKDSDGKFVCTVKVFDECYKSPSGMNSKPDAKESAARQACQSLGLADTVLGGFPPR